jgi:hypothetical protein
LCVSLFVPWSDNLFTDQVVSPPVSHAPRRAALTLLCATAVLFGATLFPATGLGSAPGAEQPDDGPSTVERTTTETATTTTEATETATETTTRTTTTTETTTARDDRNDREGSPLTGLFSGGSGGLVAVLLLALGVVAYHRRGDEIAWLLSTGPDRDREPRTPKLLSRIGAFLPDPVTRVLGGVPQATMVFVFAVADGALSASTLLGRSVGGVLAGIAGVFTALARLFAGIPAAFTGGLSGAAGALFGGVADLPESVGRLASGAATRGDAEADAGDRDAVPTDDLRDDRTEDGPPSVDDAWDALTDRVDLSNPEARTPGEFARAAIERGLPAEPVRRLTSVVRDVTYGGLPRTNERVDAARSAHEAIDSGGDGE